MISLVWLAAMGVSPAQAKIANVLISAHGNEPSIAISRKDPNIIVAGANIDEQITSSDGGKTWTMQHMKSPLGEAGDPALTSDSEGNLYYIHLSNGGGATGWLDCIVCQKSTDGGKTWSAGSAIGKNPPADQDKAWPVAHPTKPWIYTTWTQFDKYGSKDPKDLSNIMFSMSQDGGATWSTQLRINDLPGDCLDSDNTTEGAVPAVDADGTIYVAWSNQGKIFFDRSSDDGKTWLPKDILAASHVGGWDMDIPGVNRCNGMPVLVCDNSPAKTKGTLTIVFADQRFGEEDTDIFMIQSTDKGQTWSKPARVNQDKTHKQQFLPWLAIDQTTGILYTVYYDRRAHEGAETDVYVAWTTDGKTFHERKISETPFVPRKNAFMGDYNNISAHAGKIAAIWARMDQGATSIWGAVMKHEDLR